ncbi:metallophosphoesterase [Runella sp. CRIBMP]|uniref:metallophosphoesterase family protein n=1 Tax=Runella sp. CRIBMP TaxID=2683261 RepID=UPI001412DA51|nr:metallophosphoesterase [Runella sp. CRIBMP]NBB18530.1 metallophosphoesterase [Runella sp. CRIBMP]
MKNHFYTARANPFSVCYFTVLLFFGFLLSTTSFAQKAQKVKFGLFTDVHVPTMHDAKERLTAFMDSMKTAKPDFIIELGDFGTPAPKYAYGFDIWKSYAGPKYQVIGNHEMDGGFSLPQALAYRGMSSSYYSFQQNGFYFIVLDGNDKKTPDVKGYQQYIGEKQLAWLKDELAKAKTPIVIFSHQGLGKDGVDNSADIRAMLEAHNAKAKKNKIIVNFYGHIHYDRADNINGIWYVCINSMSYKWLGEEYGHVRYSEQIDKDFKWIKYTAPYKDPLYTVIEISTKGTISIAEKKSEWVGPAPEKVGFPVQNSEYEVPEIRARMLKFKP